MKIFKFIIKYISLIILIAAFMCLGLIKTPAWIYIGIFSFVILLSLMISNIIFNSKMKKKKINMKEILEKALESKDLANEDSEYYYSKMKRLLLLAKIYSVIIIILLSLVSVMFVYLKAIPICVYTGFMTLFVAASLVLDKFENNKQVELNRNEYLYIFNLIDNVQKKLNINYSYKVLPIDDINVGVTYYDGRITILLGLLCLKLLNEKELEAILYHEFAHVINEDVLKSRKIYTLINRINQMPNFTKIIFYAYLDYVLTIEWNLYSHNIQLKSEIKADELIKDRVDAQMYIDSLAKITTLIHYNENCCFFPLYKDNEECPKDYLNQIFNLYLEDVKKNKDLYELYIRKELTVRFPTHPITKERMKTIGLDTFNLDHKEKDVDFNDEVNKIVDKFNNEWSMYNNVVYKESRKMDYLRYLSILENFNEESKGSNELSNIGYAYEVTYNDDKAIDFYKKAIEINKDNSFALLRLGFILYKRNDESCKELIWKAIELNSNYVEHGIQIIGSFVVRNGDEEGLKEIRRRQVELTQKEIDKIYEEEINRKSILVKTELKEEVLNKINEVINKTNKILEVKALTHLINENKKINYISILFSDDSEESLNINEELYHYIENVKDDDYRLLVINAYPSNHIYVKMFYHNNVLEIYKKEK